MCFVKDDDSVIEDDLKLVESEDDEKNECNQLESDKGTVRYGLANSGVIALEVCITNGLNLMPYLSSYGWKGDAKSCFQMKD